MKPRKSSGGKGIQHWKPGQQVPGTHFLEEYLQDATTYAAVYVALGNKTHLLGISRQLTGEPWLHGPGQFSYSGSIGPVEFPEAVELQLQMLGEILAKADPQLRGLFGVDFLYLDHAIILLEVNPRYTASVEIIELANSIPTMLLHAQAFGFESDYTLQISCHGKLGKAIYYAPCDFSMPALDWQVADGYTIPKLADITPLGTFITRGTPVCTFFATGAGDTEVLHKLQEQAAWFDGLIQNG